MQEIAHSLFLKRKPLCAETATERETEISLCEEPRLSVCVRVCGICIPSTFSAAHRIIPLFPLILIYAAPESACACEDVLLLHALSLALSLVCRMNNMPSRGPLCRTDRNEREREIASSSVSLHTVFFCPRMCVRLIEDLRRIRTPLAN